jgi:hypothetical protein
MSLDVLNATGASEDASATVKEGGVGGTEHILKFHRQQMISHLVGKHPPCTGQRQKECCVSRRGS